MIAWTCYHDMTAAASLAVVRLHFEQLFRLGCPSSLGRDLSSLEVSNVALGARQPYTTAGHPQAAAPLSGAGKARGFVYARARSCCRLRGQTSLTSGSPAQQPGFQSHSRAGPRHGQALPALAPAPILNRAFKLLALPGPPTSFRVTSLASGGQIRVSTSLQVASRGQTLHRLAVSQEPRLVIGLTRSLASAPDSEPRPAFTLPAPAAARPGLHSPCLGRPGFTRLRLAVLRVARLHSAFKLLVPCIRRPAGRVGHILLA